MPKCGLRMKLKTLFLSDEGKHAIIFICHSFLICPSNSYTILLPTSWLFLIALRFVSYIYWGFYFPDIFERLTEVVTHFCLIRVPRPLFVLFFCHSATLGFRKIHISMSYTSYTKFLLPQLPQFSLFITILTNLWFLENNKTKFAVGNSSTNKFYWTA